MKQSVLFKEDEETVKNQIYNEYSQSELISQILKSNKYLPKGSNGISFEQLKGYNKETLVEILYNRRVNYAIIKNIKKSKKNN